MPNSIGCLGTYKIVCCGCQKFMDFKVTNEERMMGKASHSFCSECVKEQKKAIVNTKGERNRKDMERINDK